MSVTQYRPACSVCPQNSNQPQAVTEAITVEHGDRVLIELTRALDTGDVLPRSLRLTRPALR